MKLSWKLLILPHFMVLIEFHMSIVGSVEKGSEKLYDTKQTEPSEKRCSNTAG